MIQSLSYSLEWQVCDTVSRNTYLKKEETRGTFYNKLFNLYMHLWEMKHQLKFRRKAIL